MNSYEGSTFCQWCPTAGTCMQPNGAASCGSEIISECHLCPSRYGLRTTCGDQTSCYQCLSPANRGTCSWCTSSGICLADDDAAHYCPSGQLKNDSCATVAPHGCVMWTACETCTQAPSGNCGWCESTRLCHEGSSSGPSTGSCSAGWDWLSNECPATPAVTPVPYPGGCSSLSSCESCTTNPACGWCGRDQVCQEGTGTSHCAATWRQGSGSCSTGLGCQYYTSCSACTADTGCGWCSHQGTCAPGGEHGPLYGICGAGEWYYTHCEGLNCGSHQTCSGCTAEAGCGWCSGNQCMRGSIGGPSGSGGALCNSWFFHSNECSSTCYENQDCSSCLADKHCGWCTWSFLPEYYVAQCMYSSSASSSFPDSGYCPASDWINHESGACPVTPEPSSSGYFATAKKNKVHP